MASSKKPSVAVRRGPTTEVEKKRWRREEKGGEDVWPLQRRRSRRREESERVSSC